MRILMINVVCGIRSTGRICTDLAKELETRGHEVKIAYGRDCVPEQYQRYAIRIGSDIDVKLHGVKARMLDGAGFGSKKVTEKFIKWVKEYDPDVIHLHNLHGYYLNIEVLFDFLQQYKKKIIWTLHDCWAFTGHAACCDTNNCEKWKKGCGLCPLIKDYPKSYIDRSRKNWLKKKEIITSVSDMQIITPSYWLAKLVKQSFMGKYKINVIHNGIDTRVFHLLQSDIRKKYGIGNRFIILGVASIWENRKGLADFIALSKKLDESYSIVLVGAIKKQNLPSNIISIENTNAVEELVKIYSAADIFLNLTYSDNYPTVNLEAISCGKSVITYETGGSPEILREEGCGFVVAQGDIDAVFKIIENIRKEPEKYQNIKIDRKKIDSITTMEMYLSIFNQDT